MTKDDWLKLIARITADSPADLDGQHPPQHSGTGSLPCTDLPVSEDLWRRNETATYVGIRVDSPAENADRLALRLASMALERGVEPIILSTVDLCGFEQFGFRIERLPPEPEALRTAFEDEVAAFWNLAMVLDLSEVEYLS